MFGWSTAKEGEDTQKSQKGLNNKINHVLSTQL